MVASAKERRKLILLLLVGWLAACGVYTWFFVAWLDHQHWDTATATVDSVTMAEPPFGSAEACASRNTANERLIVVVVYTFEVDGRSYTSDQFTREYRGEIECTRPDAEKTKAKYEQAKSITVHYDPNDPNKSVVRLPDALVIYLFGFVLAIALGVLVLAYFRRPAAT